MRSMLQYLQLLMHGRRYVSKLNPHVMISVNDPHAVETAVELLKSGHVIAVPTDTVYGLACCATNSAAISKLYNIKSRDENKPVAICLGGVLDIEKWAQVSHLPNDLLNSLLPGPVTLILHTTNILDKSLCSSGKIGIRIPDYPFMQNIVNNSPLALTSANISGKPSSIKVTEFEPLWHKIAGIFDGGVLGTDTNSRSASTVVDLSRPGFYSIVRDGIAVQTTVKTLKKFGLEPV